MKSKKLRIFLGIVLVSLLVFIISPGYRIASYLFGLPDPLWRFRCLPTISETEVSSVEIQINSWKTPNEVISVKSTDRSAIAMLMGVIAKSEETRDHRCGSIGVIKLATRAGKTEELEILPGHDAQHYEYRFNQCINRVDRESFYKAMKAFGVKALPIDNSEELETL
jgi:hypothetical protein